MVIEQVSALLSFFAIFQLKTAVMVKFMKNCCFTATPLSCLFRSSVSLDQMLLTNVQHYFSNTDRIVRLTHIYKLTFPLNHGPQGLLEVADLGIHAVG